MKNSPSFLGLLRKGVLAVSAIFLTQFCFANTITTNTRAEVSFMATLWETDTLNISPLANAQYPQFSNDWQYIFPHANISADGDIHNDMAVDSSGNGSTNNNTGESPIIVEVVNATSSQLNNLHTLSGARTKPRGIFRLYTEHASERHFELHPVTQLFVWNGSTFVLSNDYHANIKFVSDGAGHPNSTLTNLLNGTISMTATAAVDNVHITFGYPSPGVNYVQYDGVTTSGLQNDGVSQYFFLRPNLVTQAVVRCRIVAGTAAATLAATNLVAHQTLTVNALTRTDMLAVSNQIASLTAGQSKTFARPVELITLSLTNLEAVVAPTLTALALTNQQFRFTVTGAAGHSYTVQTSTNLTTTNWLSLFTSPAPFTFTDTDASNFIQRFYRAVY